MESMGPYFKVTFAPKMAKVGPGQTVAAQSDPEPEVEQTADQFCGGALPGCAHPSDHWRKMDNINSERIGSAGAAQVPGP
jgi:hypothetical protein